MKENEFTIILLNYKTCHKAKQKNISVLTKKILRKISLKDWLNHPIFDFFKIDLVFNQFLYQHQKGFLSKWEWIKTFEKIFRDEHVLCFIIPKNSKLYCLFLWKFWHFNVLYQCFFPRHKSCFQERCACSYYFSVYKSQNIGTTYHSIHLGKPLP